jgi:hypothetical protein
VLEHVRREDARARVPGLAQTRDREERRLGRLDGLEYADDGQQRDVERVVVAELAGLEADEQRVAQLAAAEVPGGLELVAEQLLAVVQLGQQPHQDEVAGEPREGAVEERAVALPVEVGEVQLVAQRSLRAEAGLEVHAGAQQALLRTVETATGTSACAARRAPCRR